jgi:phosphoribosylformylglycinamidine (FGAM) synthase-like enzyme
MPTTSTFDERLVVAIDSKRLEALRAIAKREELSIGAVVRRLVRELLEREAAVEPDGESAP